MDFKNSKINHDEIMERQQAHRDHLQRGIDEVDSLPTDTYGASGGKPHFDPAQRKILSAKEYIDLPRILRATLIGYAVAFCLGIMVVILTALFLAPFSE